MRSPACLCVTRFKFWSSSQMFEQSNMNFILERGGTHQYHTLYFPRNGNNMADLRTWEVGSTLMIPNLRSWNYVGYGLMDPQQICNFCWTSMLCNVNYQHGGHAKTFLKSQFHGDNHRTNGIGHANCSIDIGYKLIYVLRLEESAIKHTTTVLNIEAIPDKP